MEYNHKLTKITQLLEIEEDLSLITNFPNPQDR